MERHITLPLTREEARTIKSGEQLLLSGVIYTARDAAHKRLCELVEKGEPLPEPRTNPGGEENRPYARGRAYVADRYDGESEE